MGKHVKSNIVGVALATTGGVSVGLVVELGTNETFNGVKVGPDGPGMGLFGRILSCTFFFPFQQF